MRTDAQVLHVIKATLQNYEPFKLGLCAIAYELRGRGDITYEEEGSFKDRIKVEHQRRMDKQLPMYGSQNRVDEEGPYLWKLGSKAPRTRWLNKVIKELKIKK